MLAVGAADNDASVAATPADNSLTDSGAVYIARRDSAGETPFTTPIFLKPSTPAANAQFGLAVSLSGNGNTLAVGTGGNGTGNAANTDEVYIFNFLNNTWTATAYSPITLPAATANDVNVSGFGRMIALNQDATSLAVYTQNTRRMLDETQTSLVSINNENISNDSNPADITGSVTVFALAETAASSRFYFQPPFLPNLAFDNFGQVLELSSDGSRILAGTVNENSGAGGVNNEEQASQATPALDSGAAWIYQINK